LECGNFNRFGFLNLAVCHIQPKRECAANLICNENLRVRFWPLIRETEFFFLGGGGGGWGIRLKLQKELGIEK
jgi:hypothetical protein